MTQSVSISRKELMAFVLQSSQAEAQNLAQQQSQTPPSSQSPSSASSSSSSENATASPKKMAKPKLKIITSPITPTLSPTPASSSVIESLSQLPSALEKRRSADKKRPSSKKKPPGLGVSVDTKSAPTRSRPDEIDVKFTNTGTIHIGDIMRIGSAGIKMSNSEHSETSTTTGSSSTSSNSSKKSSASGSLLRSLSPKQKINFDKLKKIKVLGEGATSRVSLVKDTVTGNLYAQKSMIFDQETSPKLVLSELKSLYECTSPHIIKLYDAYNREGRIHIIIEYMNYGTLKHVMEKTKTIPENIISQVAEQILLGLEYIHNTKKIVHRDIKPENILLNSKGEVKLSDFGLSKEQNQTDFAKTFVGSFAYMSLERLRGEKHSYDSDIWSFAIMLVECFSGSHPFGSYTRFWDLIKHLGEKQEILDFSGMTPEFKDFLLQCLKLNPSERASASSLLKHQFITKHKNTSPSLIDWLAPHFTNNTFPSPPKQLLQ